MRLYMKPDPHIGQIRKKSKYLIFPKKIGTQLRWLEKATWEEKYGYGKLDNKRWIAFKWINE